MITQQPNIKNVFSKNSLRSRGSIPEPLKHHSRVTNAHAHETRARAHN